MKYATYFKSGLGNFINAIPAFMVLANCDEREKIDLVLDKDWINDPRVPAIKELAEESFYIDRIIYWPDVDFDQYEKFFIPVQCEPSKCAKEMIRRNKEKGVIKYIWPNPVWRKTFLNEIDVNLKNIERLRLAGYNSHPGAVYIPLADGPLLLGCHLFPGQRPYLFVGLCNGAFQAKFWEKKKWPYFAPLAKKLKKYFKRIKLIGIGGPDELEGCDLDIDYTGGLTITETAKVISQLDYFITTDTGCMHIADVLKIKGLGLFGPTLISKNGPVHGTIHAVRKDLRCAPCQEEEGFYTCNANACMDLMTSDLVMDRIIKDLN